MCFWNGIIEKQLENCTFTHNQCGLKTVQGKNLKNASSLTT